MITQQDQFLTSGDPMKEWFDAARILEQQDGVLSASPFPMQPWLDVKEGGWTSLVYTDGDPERAQKLADQLADHAWSLRDRFWMIRVDSPGTTQSDLRAFTWKRLPRPIHPLDDLAEWRASES